MSGPKSYEARVVSAEELQRREDAARQSRCQSLQADLNEAIKGLRNYHVSFSSVKRPTSINHDSLITWEKELNTALAEARSTLRDEERKVILRGLCAKSLSRMKCLSGDIERYGITRPRLDDRPLDDTLQALKQWHAQILAAISRVEAEIIWARKARATLKRINENKEAVDASQVSLGAGTVSTPRGSNAEADEQAKMVAQIANEVSSLVSILAGLDDEKQRGELIAEVEQLLAITSISQMKGDLLTVKTRLNGALIAQQCRDMAKDILLSVSGIDSEKTAALMAFASVVKTAKDVKALQKEANELIKAEKKAADEAFIQTVLEEELAKLGFNIADGFKLTDYGRIAIVDCPDNPGYGLRIQHNPDKGRIMTRVVAFGDSTPEEDAAVEEITCKSVYQIAGNLRKRGVSTALVSEKQPGTYPVDKIAGGRPAEAKTTEITPVKGKPVARLRQKQKRKTTAETRGKTL
jgi:hypothetical protein